MLIAAPASGQDRNLPSPADDNERAVIPAISAVMASGRPTLPPLDAALARLPKPTPLRGAVQSMRSIALMGLGRRAEALDAARESVRLMPGNAVSRLIASEVMTYAGAPHEAAVDWLEASTIDPELARRTRAYDLHALVGRLDDTGDRDLAERLTARMAEIGMEEATSPARSGAALSKLKAAFARGGTPAASPLISGVLAPGDLRELYLDVRYRPLWPAIAAWAGEDFGSLQRRYFEDLRREAFSSRDIAAAANYARALIAVRAYEPVIALFLPRLNAPADTARDESVVFVAPILARALMTVGRVPEAEALLDRIDRAFPAEAAAMRLNLSAAMFNLRIMRGDFAGGLPLIERWLQTARTLGAEVNLSAILQVQELRVCALERLGRLNEAAGNGASIIGSRANIPKTAFSLYACRSDLAGGRDLLVESLADPNRRAWALALVQPKSADPRALPLMREESAFVDRVRTDPAVRAAVDKVGRILPIPLADDLPAGFDPLQKSPVTSATSDDD